MNTNVWLAIAGLLIIIALAAYAWFLWGRVWHTQQLRATQEAERNDRLAGDIQLLAQSLLNGQLPLIEGAIRIKVLLDNYSGPRQQNLDMEIFEVIYDATAHIPTHQRWKNLSKAERHIHQQQMDVLERDNRERVVQAATQLSEGLV
ncbi:MAG TPA: DUF2489 domain-containing protein [Pseudomonas xinjiangensis]|uniref:DUF2489 domain-containing protein n=2 Tax=root TaxID=1 RepID=A0A7V1FS08_9GAMM|nr:DUF2489 domain-containing protein [Halopseudomonas xinjiangensis]HEC46587.1 DUF2489 domain-containing protein [Halopseudomonas xinjiangensis]